MFSGQPYPVLDPRVTLTKLPSLDIWNDQYPGRFPGYWEIKSKGDLAEVFTHLKGTFGEPLAFSVRIHEHLKKRLREFDLVHDNQCLGYGILKIEEKIPTIVTLHHPITRDRALEMEHTKNWRKRYSIGRWYNFVKMQGRVASRMPRVVVVSENSIKDIHADMGVSYDRMRLVPVGVDPDLFVPRPEVARQPGRLITTASADVALKGLSYLLEAMAKLRTERDIRLTIIGKPRPGHSMDLIEKLGLADFLKRALGTTPPGRPGTMRTSNIGFSLLAALVERTADDVLLPLTGVTLRSALHVPDAMAGAALEGDGLACEAVKPSDDGDWIVLRCRNVTSVERRGAWTLGVPVSVAQRARLDETPIDELSVSDGRIEFTAPAHSVTTVLVR